MFDAARVGDTTWHGTLTGPGCPKVQIGNKPAWRVGDTHLCALCNPPPGSTPHGTGRVLKGSFTVLVGGKPATRVTDIVIEPAAILPPQNNLIIAACKTVQIGDQPFGLMSPEVLAAFCAQWRRLLDDWDTIVDANGRPDERERQRRLKEITDNALERAGAHPLKSLTEGAPAGSNGMFYPSSYSVQVKPGTFGGPRPSGSLARTLIHEARHAEQTYSAARYLAGQGKNGAQIAQSMRGGIPQDVAQAAAGRGVPSNSPRGQHGLMTFKNDVPAGRFGSTWSVPTTDRAVAAAANHSSNPAEFEEAFENYKGIPVEADAFATEDALADICPAARGD